MRKATIMGGAMLVAVVAALVLVMDRNHASSQSSPSSEERVMRQADGVRSHFEKQQQVAFDRAIPSVKRLRLATPERRPGESQSSFEHRMRYQSRLQELLERLSEEKRTRVLSILHDTQENWRALDTDMVDQVAEEADQVLVLRSQGKHDEAEALMEEQIAQSGAAQLGANLEAEVHTRMKEVLGEEEYRLWKEGWVGVPVFGILGILEPE